MSNSPLVYSVSQEDIYRASSPPLVKSFKTLLIANRGEISIRIARSAYELGLRTIAIYSYEDRYSMHRYKADEAWQIAPVGKYSPVAAYLAMDEIIKIAKTRNVDCIHPGYGFLSENAVFARKVKEAGMSFIGPPAEVIEKMGDKTKARKIAIEAKVPVVPGTEGAVSDIKQVEDFVKEYGLPIIIKAAMGGGGRGMRVVRNINELKSSFERAQSEALQSFGDGTIFVERFLERPKHIEVQLLGDQEGNIIHLFERDCSVQRRHQKVVEVAPAANIPAETRKNILNDALKLAKYVGYQNAGTAEFLVDKEGRHYFIEINPRIQVEHTITEEITGLDIVAAQIKIANGSTLKELGLLQKSIQIRGHAIQCRITTEDPANGFAPDTGKIEVYRSAGGQGVRLDGGAGYAGASISPYYDSLLVKVTCTGNDYEIARRKVIRALSEFRIRGVKTNIPFLKNLLNHEIFIKGDFWTTCIEDTPELFLFSSSKNRAQKLLSYLGDMAVNGSQIKGQKGEPGLRDQDPSIPLPLPFSLPPDAHLKPQNLRGWRQVLLENGPETFAKAVRSHKGLLIMDTTWRDAHQSLLATRVRTIDIARIAPLTSHILKNAFAIEMFGGATFDVCLRFLYECPWDRLKKLRQLCPNVPFQMLLRGANAVGYTSYPDDVVYEFCKHAKECGIDIFRIFDSLNYVENLKLGIDAVRKAGGVIEGTICYTGDVSDSSRTRYDLKYYLDLTKQLVDYGIHILGIKDMAGLLKPKAAKLLVSAIRAQFPDLPIHVHTHDTAGNGVASMLQAAEAGADVVDLALDSMSGVTSQPCMGAFVAASQGTSIDTGLVLSDLQVLNSYWEQVRLLYQCFDPQVNSPSSEVYLHQMPGGQYTNLLFQASSLGLGQQWTQIKKAYRIANDLCGDIVKVTPSSKVVGDFAQFIVANNLTAEDVLEKADTLSFPKSVVEYFQGYLGIPPYGFNETLRAKIVKNLPRIEGRPGKSLPSLDLKYLKESLQKKFSKDAINDQDVMSAALYPQVFDEFMKQKLKYGDLSILPTRYFLSPLKHEEELTVSIEPGKTLIIKFLALGAPNHGDGSRDVFFLLNGESRVLKVADLTAAVERKVRQKADPNRSGDLGAPMSGVVVDIRVKEGSKVNIGDPICVLSAMKMETVVSSPSSGVVTDLSVQPNDSLTVMDLICKIKKA